MSFNVLKSLIPDLVKQDYNYGPFKLIYNNLSLTNLIIKNNRDLTVVKVIDFE
jgi:hypothetical protein